MVSRLLLLFRYLIFFFSPAFSFDLVCTERKTILILIIVFRWTQLGHRLFWINAILCLIIAISLFRLFCHVKSMSMTLIAPSHSCSQEIFIELLICMEDTVPTTGDRVIYRASLVLIFYSSSNYPRPHWYHPFWLISLTSANTRLKT